MLKFLGLLALSVWALSLPLDAQPPLLPAPLIEPADAPSVPLVMEAATAPIAAAREIDRTSSFGRALVGASAGWAAGAAVGWGVAHALDAEQYGMIPPIMVGGAVGSGIGAHLRNESRGSWPVNVLATAVSIPIMIIPQMLICWESCEGHHLAGVSAGYAVTQIPSAAVTEWAVGRLRDR